MNEGITNAVIESADIDTERGLNVWIHLDYGGCGQGFGGYILYVPRDWKHHSVDGPNYGGHFIYRCLEVAGVEKWSQMRGKTVRADIQDGLIKGIGHIVKDDWFYPGKDFLAATEQEGET